MSVRVEPRYRSQPAPGVAYAEFRNTQDRRLILSPPGAIEPIHVGPKCPRLIRVADLEQSPEVAAWLEGCELRGVRRRMGS